MIDFSAPFWFENYLQYRKHHPLAFNSVGAITQVLDDSKTFTRFESLENPFYAVLQQSGLVYGFPVHYPFEDPSGLIKKLSDSDRAKFILLDIMMYARLMEHPIPDGATYTEAIEKNGKRIRNYYEALHRTIKTTTADMLEQILFRQVQFKKNYFDFRKTGINSQLFWDLYCFLDYCEAIETADYKEINYFSDLIERKKTLKKITLQLIAATAHADHHISRQEKALHQHFERSSKLLSEQERTTLLHFFETGIKLEEIEIPALDWIARRFLLDICLLTIHVDAKVETLEEAFFVPLLQKLRLTPDDLMSAKADLGCFLYLHGEKLHVFKGKKTGILLLGEAMMANFVKLGYAAKMEAVETRDMATTFGKLLISKLNLSKNKELPNEQEIKEAFEQLKDIPKFLPFFGVVFMPVPGITEAYILLAFSIEKLSGGNIRLLPSQISKLVRGEKEKKNQISKPR